MKPIVVVGSINMDLVCSVERIPIPGETLSGRSFATFHGGKGANQAVAVARLGYPAHMLGKVGDDEFGARLRDGLQSAGVGVQSVTVGERLSSGVALISVDASGENSIVIVAGANGAIQPADVERWQALLGSAKMILMQLEIPMDAVECTAQIAEKLQVPVMLDPAPARELSASLLQKITYLTPNETEAGALCGASVAELNATTAPEYAASLLARGPRHVILKMGQRGAYALSQGGEAFSQPAFRVQAVDSTAAGDAFNGALAVALSRGGNLRQAARFAAAAAAISVGRAGAQPSMPRESEVECLLRSQPLTTTELDATAGVAAHD